MAEYVVKLADERGRIQEQVQIAGSAEEGRRIGDRLDAGVVSVQDTFLTFAAFGAGLQSDSFKFSGIGTRSGIMAFIRKQGVLVNCASPACLVEENLQAVR